MRVAFYLFCVGAIALSLAALVDAASMMTITSPTANQVIALSNSSSPVATVPLAATTSPSGASYWAFSVKYQTRGTFAIPAVGLGNITLAAGTTGSLAVSGSGGLLFMAANTLTSPVVTRTAYIGGTNPSASVITSTLVSQYQSSSQFSGTTRLLTGLADKESSYLHFRSFKHPTYGITAFWPNDNATAPNGAGGFVGLMQVPTTMSTAFHWVNNIKKGVSVFNDKLVAARSSMNTAMSTRPLLPAMSGTKLEDNALVRYGPWAGYGGTWKGRWVPNSSGTAWVETTTNPGGVAYVLDIRSRMH